MINRIIRYYNQNRKAIIIFIISVAFVIFLIQLLKNASIKKNQDIINQEINKRNQIVSSNNKVNNSTVSNNELNNKDGLTNREKAVDEFVKYCNQGEVDKAYNILSDDCKKAMFTTKDKFKSEYYDKVFNSKKMYSLESSKYGNTVSKITYYNDALSTGTLTESKYVDYIYTVKENEKEKISINGFLYTDKINKNYQGKSIDINVIEKQVYIDYEIYTINFTNNSANRILLDTKKDKNSLNVSDRSGTKYASYVDTMATEMLVIGSKVSRTIDIKFNKMYNENRNVDTMNIQDIVSNYDNYIAGKEYETIKLSLKL